MSQSQSPYFRRPIGLVGIFFIAFWAFFAAAFFTQPARQNRGLAGTPVAEESTTGKAVNAPGGRFNPVPLGSAFLIGDGRLHVNSFTRAMTEEVEAVNRFNPDPDPDEEWVLLNLAYACDLPEGENCNASNLRFELEGAETIYNNNFVMVLNDEFAGNIPGGGQLTGNIGFIVNQNDENLLLLVTDPTGQTYFSTTAAAAGASP